MYLVVQDASFIQSYALPTVHNQSMNVSDDRPSKCGGIYCSKRGIYTHGEATIMQFHAIGSSEQGVRVYVMMLMIPVRYSTSVSTEKGDRIY